MMAGGVESWSPSPSPPEGRGEGKVVVVGGAMVMDFSLDDSGATSFLSSSSSSPKLPRRFRRRLFKSKSPQNCTVEDIEAKLRHADLCRQVSLPLSLSLFVVVLEYEDSFSTLLFLAVVVVIFFFFFFFEIFLIHLINYYYH